RPMGRVEKTDVNDRIQFSAGAAGCVPIGPATGPHFVCGRGRCGKSEKAMWTASFRIQAADRLSRKLVRPSDQPRCWRARACNATRACADPPGRPRLLGCDSGPGCGDPAAHLAGAAETVRLAARLPAGLTPARPPGRPLAGPGPASLDEAVPAQELLNDDAVPVLALREGCLVPAGAALGRFGDERRDAQVVAGFAGQRAVHRGP